MYLMLVCAGPVCTATLLPALTCNITAFRVFATTVGLKILWLGGSLCRPPSASAPSFAAPTFIQSRKVLAGTCSFAAAARKDNVPAGAFKGVRVNRVLDH